MARIERSISDASAAPHDLIVIGGGIHGVLLTLEAAMRGLRPLLLERDDFGAHTTRGSLRILHGGLRYLQRLDLRRHRESTVERSWFLSRFPQHVRPLPCVLPLYGRGWRRVPVMRVALHANDLMARGRNRGLDDAHALPNGRMLGSAEVLDRVPMAEPEGLEGGALWYDAHVVHPERLLVDALAAACARGARALNYLEARELIVEDGAVRGVSALDRASDATAVFRSELVVAAAGPWTRELGRRFGLPDAERLFRPTLAWNVLLASPASGAHALVVSTARGSARALLLVPWKGRILAGTGYAPWGGDGGHPAPSAALLESFLEEIRAAAPGFRAGLADVQHVYAGLLPLAWNGGERLAQRPRIVDHGRRGGPRGLITTVGVKYTTARRVALDILSLADRSGLLPRPLPARSNDLPGFGGTEAGPVGAPSGDLPIFAPIENSQNLAHAEACLEPEWSAESLGPVEERLLRERIREESVLHLDDLVVRRTGIGDHPRTALTLAPRIARLFPWNEERTALEIARLRECLLNVPGGD